MTTGGYFSLNTLHHLAYKFERVYVKRSQKERQNVIIECYKRSVDGGTYPMTNLVTFNKDDICLVFLDILVFSAWSEMGYSQHGTIDANIYLACRVEDDANIHIFGLLV